MNNLMATYAILILRYNFICIVVKFFTHSRPPYAIELTILKTKEVENE